MQRSHGERIYSQHFDKFIRAEAARCWKVIKKKNISLE